jgi:carboxypeptidase PM20D1
MKKIIALAGLALILLAAVVLIRTLLFSTGDGPGVPLVAVDVDEASITAHMSQAIQFRTISTGDPTTQDFTAFKAFTQWVTATYPELSAVIPLEIIAEHTLLYRWQGSNPDLKPILLTAHYDVVPVAPGTEANWTHPPFAGVVTDGYVWGRGALDNKNGVIVMLEAVTKLVKEGFVPERTLYLSFGHDEEIGGVSGAKSVADLLQSQGVQLAWTIDEGSSIATGLFPGFETPVAMINVAEKGSMTLDITANGPGGHSSIPAAEVPIDILAQALVKLRKRPVPGGLDGVTIETLEGIARRGPYALRVLVANRWLFGGFLEKQLTANSFTDAMTRTTTAPTLLRAGIKTNVISPTATATVNFRLHPRDTPESVKAHVVAAIDDERIDVKFRGEGMSSLASPVSSRDSQGYQTIAKVARQVFGDLIIVPGLTVGGTDSKHYNRVADDSYRFQYMLISPQDIAGLHGTNERITIDNLVKGTRGYYLLMKEAAGEQ